MPPERTYTEAEHRAALRQQAQSLAMDAVKVELTGIKEHLAANGVRLDQNNHLRQTMATKKDMSEMEGRILAAVDTRMADVVTVEKLQDGDLWVRVGVPAGFSAEESMALHDVAKQKVVTHVIQETKKARLALTNAHLAIISIVAGLMIAASSAAISFASYQRNSAPRVVVQVVQPTPASSHTP